MNRIHIECDFSSGKTFPSSISIVQYSANIDKIEVSLYSNVRLWEIPSGYSVNIRMEKSDGMKVYSPAESIEGNKALINVNPQMTVVSGVHPFVIEVVAGSNIVQTFPCELKVVRNPIPNDELQSLPEYQTIQQLVEEAKKSAANSETYADQSAQSAQDAQEWAKKAQDAIPSGGDAGQILIKQSDTDWDMSWGDIPENLIEKGISDYMENHPIEGVAVDPSLTQSGLAADAKVTGDALAEKAEKATTLAGYGITDGVSTGDFLILCGGNSLE